MFAPECLNLFGMKGIFKNVYDHLAHLGLRMDECEDKLAGIPDFSALTAAVRDCQTK